MTSQMDIIFSNSQFDSFNKSSIGELYVAKREAKNGQIVVAIHIASNQSINEVSDSSKKICSFRKQ